MTLSRTTTYLVLTRAVDSRLTVTVPMINLTFFAADTAEAGDRARELIARELGVRPDSFSVDVVGLAQLPAQRRAA